MEHLMQQLFDFFSGIGKEPALFLISMVPLIELRGSIPFGAAMGMPFSQVFFLSVLGNLLPIPFIIFFVRPVFDWLKTTKLFSGLAHKLEHKIMSKADKVTRYEMIGLLLFVAIPLPGTGAWTGAGLAALLGMRVKHAFVSILCGVLIAGIIMSIVSYGVVGIVSAF